MSIRPRDRETLLNALRTGVVPHVGQQLIQVGRNSEIAALVKDLDRVCDGGSLFRIVVGDYGAGKTFFLNLIRSIALEKKLVVLSADLNPDRRLHASAGQARSLYAELVRNASTRAKPEGAALLSIIEKFYSSCQDEAEGKPLRAVVQSKLRPLEDMVNGFDFVQIVIAYCESAMSNDEERKTNAVRWLRGEFATKTDARAALGVRSIVDDSNVYDQLKLLCAFCRIAGYSGLLVNLDELVNLYKLSNTQARNANYEQLLRMLNDTLQGQVQGLGFILGGTPEFLMDTRRGLYSYPALQSRLAQNVYATGALVDFTGPVLRLSALTPEDFFLLLVKLRDVFNHGCDEVVDVPEQAIESFMVSARDRVGDAYFKTPRNTIIAFLNLLATLQQNRGTTWSELVGGITVAADLTPADEADADLVEFKL